MVTGALLTSRRRCHLTLVPAKAQIPTTTFQQEQFNRKDLTGTHFYKETGNLYPFLKIHFNLKLGLEKKGVEKRISFSKLRS